jgi:membrane protease YdiL (CAAX protease family)
MRPVRALLIYLSTVFIGGALLAPWLWHLAQLGPPWFPHLAHTPFHRYVDRSMQVIALAGLWPFMRALGATSRREIGLVSPVGQFRKLGAGLLSGFASLACVAVVSLAGHGRAVAPHLSAGKIIGTLAGAAATAVVVSLLEEILFRGGVFGGLRRVVHWTTAMVISSVIYALVHFLQGPQLTGPVQWDSGLIALRSMLAGFGDFHQLVPGFFSLTVAGLWLALACQRTGNLYFSIGLHAGWVFWLKTFGGLTTPAPGAPSWFYGSGRLVDGWLAFCILFLFLVAFTLWHPPSGRRTLKLP